MISIFCLLTVSVFLLIVGWPLGFLYENLGGERGSYISGMLFGAGLCSIIMIFYLISLRCR